MKVLDLFSGIGGFSLGLERAGMTTVAFCEIDRYCRTVLAHHWPHVPIYDDIHELTADRLAADGIEPDLLTGGFPCQDASLAGSGRGLAGERTGLWRQQARLVGELGPRWVLAENVTGLRTRGADRVLSDLEALGYTAWPIVVGAEHVGAPHRRHRVWILAHRNGERLRQSIVSLGALAQAALAENAGGPMADRNRERRLLERLQDPSGLEGEAGHEPDRCNGAAVAEPAGARRGAGTGEAGGPIRHAPRRTESERHGGSVAHADREPRDRREQEPRRRAPARAPADRTGEAMVDAGGAGSQERHAAGEPGPARYAAGRHHPWPAGPGPYQHEWEPPRVIPRAEPGVGLGIDGLPARLAVRARREALRALGNTIVPEIAEAFGRVILSLEP